MPEPSFISLRRRLIRLLIFLGLVLAILGSRWELIGRYGTDVPQADQWDAEGVNLLVPWHQGQLTPAVLVHPHNEHRVVLSKLWSLAWVKVAGQWDQRLLMVVNAFWPALIAVALLRFAGGLLRASWWYGAALLLLLAFGWPHAWHNTLSGFHSQQFFLLAAAVGTLLGFSLSRPGTWGWWLAAVVAVMGLGSMASGAFAPLIAVPLLIVRICQKQVSLRSALGMALFCLGLAVIGLVCRPEAAHHAFLRADSVAEFMLTFLRGLRWPAAQLGWLGLLFWMPWLALLVTRLRRRQEVAPGADALLALGAWVLLQQAATAYGRGAGAPEPAIRYLDTLVVGSFVNFTALGWFAHQTLGREQRWALDVAGAGWLVLWCFTLLLPAQWIHEVTHLGQQNRQMETNLRAYLLTGDEEHLIDPLPYPGRAALLERLERPPLRQLLPASVQPPPHPTPAASRWSAWLARHGRGFWSIGGALFLGALILGFWRKTAMAPEPAA